MPAPDLNAVFASLGEVTLGEASSFEALPVPGYPRHRVARSAEGAAAVLLWARDSRYQSFASALILENVTVAYDRQCRITRAHNDDIEEECFTVVSCSSGDHSVRSYFLHVLGALCAAVGREPSRLEVSRALETVIELFRALSQPPKQSVQGLWAELFLLARSRHVALLTTSWHAQPEDRFDFAHGSERIEVKSASGRVRTHHFALEQVRPPEGISVLIASWDPLESTCRHASLSIL